MSLMLQRPHGWKQFNLQPNHDCSGTCTCGESPIYGIFGPGELLGREFHLQRGEIQYSTCWKKKCTDAPRNRVRMHQEIQYGCTKKYSTDAPSNTVKMHRTHFQFCPARYLSHFCLERFIKTTLRVSFWPRGIYEYRIVGLIVQILNMSL